MAKYSDEGMTGSSTNKAGSGSGGLGQPLHRTYPSKPLSGEEHGPIKGSDYIANGQSVWPKSSTSFPNH